MVVVDFVCLQMCPPCRAIYLTMETLGIESRVRFVKVEVRSPAKQVLGDPPTHEEADEKKEVFMQLLWSEFMKTEDGVDIARARPDLDCAQAVPLMDDKGFLLCEESCGTSSLPKSGPPFYVRHVSFMKETRGLTAEELKHQDEAVSCMSSRAIIKYLTENHESKNDWLPEKAEERHKMAEFLYFDFALYEAFKDYFYPIAAESCNPGPELLKNFTEKLNWLNFYLKKGNGGWVIGKTKSIADLAAVASVSSYKAVGLMRFNAFPNVELWIRRCEQAIPRYMENNAPGVNMFKEWALAKYIDTNELDEAEEANRDHGFVDDEAADAEIAAVGRAAPVQHIQEEVRHRSATGAKPKSVDRPPTPMPHRDPRKLVRH